MADSGIYEIVCSITGQKYIGSSYSLSNRIKAHKYRLVRNKHHSYKLQRAWNKYGHRAFSFNTLLICSKDMLIQYEQLVMDAYDSVALGFNVAPIAGSRAGIKHSEESLEKMRKIQRAMRKKYEWEGEQLCLYEIAERTGMKATLLERRVSLDGWDVERAVATPASERNRGYFFNGEYLNVNAFSEKFGVTPLKIRQALSENKTADECVRSCKQITIKELSDLLGVAHFNVSRRVQAGWGLIDALAIEAGSAPRGSHTLYAPAPNIREMYVYSKHFIGR